MPTNSPINTAAPVLSMPIRLTERQAAERLGLKPQTLANWRSTGRHGLPFLKLGRSVRYDLTALEKWAAARTATSTGMAAEFPR